jgi:hypothetical protein
MPWSFSSLDYACDLQNVILTVTQPESQDASTFTMGWICSWWLEGGKARIPEWHNADLCAHKFHIDIIVFILHNSKLIHVIKTMYTSVTPELSTVLQHMLYTLAPCSYLLEQ